MPRIDNEIRLDFKDVLFRPKRSTLKSRSEVEVSRSYTFRNSKATWSGVPIMAANMDTTGTFEMAAALHTHDLFTCIHKHYTPDDWAAFSAAHPEVLPNVAVSAGTSAADFAKVASVLDANPSVGFICLDVANGYSEHFIDTVRRAREAHASKTIIAGNVVTGEMVEELLLTGADIIKVGIGPGSVCTTRKQTGVGYPQLSAVIECADAAHGLDGHVISDGGCTCPGDVSKALGAGADFVMMGGMLSGHDESGGDVIERDGKRYKEFYGMSSAVAMQKHSGGVANYRSSEGKAITVPYRGPVAGTVYDLLGGIRSTCTYVGARRLKELPKRTTFIRVSQQINEIFGKAPPNPNVAAAAATTGKKRGRDE